MSSSAEFSLSTARSAAAQIAKDSANLLLVFAAKLGLRSAASRMKCPDAVEGNDLLDDLLTPPYD